MSKMCGSGRILPLLFPRRAAKIAFSSKATEQAAAPSFQPLEPRRLLDAVIDLRLADGGQRAEISSRDQVVQMEVWATVTGDNDDGADDGLQILIGSFLSPDRNGGAAKGTLAATLGQFYQNAGATRGKSADLDDDGDLDVGSNNDANVSGFFAVRASQPPTFGGEINGGSHSFLVATLSFKATRLLGGESTRIVFRPRQSAAVTGALWIEDGKVKTTSNGELRAGSAVTLTLAPGVEPDVEDSKPPTANLNAGNIDAPGGANHSFKVVYRDNDQLRASSIGEGDIRVTGPKGFEQLADFISADGNADGSITATYRVSSPGGAWDAGDNGSYAVAVRGEQVQDASGNAVAAGGIGSFNVSIKTVPAKLENGVLTVTGTGGNDTIRASLVKGSIRITVNGDSGNFDSGKVTRLVVNAGNGNDTVAIDAGTLATRLGGGSGDDVLTGGDGRDSIFGDSGNDRLLGGAANDLLLGINGNDVIDGQGGNDKFDGGSGTDRMSGGSGADTADYGSRRSNLKVSLDGKANDGQQGENDNVAADVEAILGGRANDLLVGSGSDNTLVGNSGNDTLRAGGGNDRLVGSAGADQLFGDAGNDFLDARDGVVEVVNGGAGTDSARVDRNDRKSSVERLV